MKRNTIVIAMSIAIGAGCSKPGSTSSGTAEPPAGGTPTAVADAPASLPAPPETVFVSTVRPPAPRREPRPVEPAPPPSAAMPSAPPEPTRGVIESGTDIATTLVDSIHSGYNGLGDPIQATVNADVMDNGRVVIPAGSVVTFRISAIQPAGSRGQKGILDMTAESVRIRGRSYPIDGVGTEYDFEMKAKSVNAGDVATAAGGAAIGAIIGHVIGGKTGTIIGAVGGGAAGTAVAAKNADRDIVVHAGTRMTLALLAPFERTLR